MEIIDIVNKIKITKCYICGGDQLVSFYDKHSNVYYLYCKNAKTNLINLIGYAVLSIKNKDDEPDKNNEFYRKINEYYQNNSESIQNSNIINCRFFVSSKHCEFFMWKFSKCYDFVFEDEKTKMSLFVGDNKGTCLKSYKLVCDTTIDGVISDNVIVNNVFIDNDLFKSLENLMTFI